jgi:hypothetical protein
MKYPAQKTAISVAGRKRKEIVLERIKNMDQIFIKVKKIDPCKE